MRMALSVYGHIMGHIEDTSKNFAAKNFPPFYSSYFYLLYMAILCAHSMLKLLCISYLSRLYYSWVFMLVLVYVYAVYRVWSEKNVRILIFRYVPSHLWFKMSSFFFLCVRSERLFICKSVHVI